MATETWVLYDPRNNTQSEQMSTEQMQFSLLKMKTRELTNYLICKVGWPSWQKLESFLNSSESHFMKPFTNPQKNKSDDEEPTVKMKPADPKVQEQVKKSFSKVQLEEINVNQVFGLGKQQFDADQLDSSNLDIKSNLDFKNINKSSLLSKNTSKEDKYKLELFLINPKTGGTFRSIAENISLSGTFSEKIIPDEFHHTNFDLIIINNFINDEQFKKVKLKAKIVITDASIYIQYIDATPDQKSLLRSSLDYYVRALKKLES